MILETDQNTMTTHRYPALPGLTIIQHLDMGGWTFDPSKVTLYQSESQSCIPGEALLHKLQSVRPLNATMLEWLLEDTTRIPRSWERAGRYLFFWGTIYKGPEVGPEKRRWCPQYVRWMVWLPRGSHCLQPPSYRGSWHHDTKDINRLFDEDDFALVGTE